jgi:sugar lactone lactonase YvrE
VGLAVDTSGNYYVSDAPDQSVDLMTLSSGSYTYSLAAQTSGVPFGLAIDANNNLFFADGTDIYELRHAPVNFGVTNVGTASATIPLTFYFDSGGQIEAPAVLTQGASALDFADAGGGTCTTNGTNHNYSTGDSCVVNVKLTPGTPGPKYGAVELLDHSSNVLATGLVYGSGTGPMVTFPPGQQTQVDSLTNAEGIAADSAGNLYVADTYNNRILKETRSGSGYSESTIPSSGLSFPYGVAVDGAGNVYVADTNNNRVVVEIRTASGYTQSTVGTGLNTPFGVAVDGLGNVYIVDTNNDRAVKETLSGGSYSQTTIRSGLGSAEGIAVDGSGNVYIADGYYNHVLMETPSGGAYTQSTVASGLNADGVAVDGSGNVYITAGTTSSIYLETLSGGTYTQSTLRANTGGALGVAVDGSGNVYYVNGSLRYLNEVVAQPQTFPNTVAGSTSSEQTVTLANLGNASLSFPIPSSGDNPFTPTNFTLDGSVGSACPLLTSSSGSVGTLGVGDTCVLAIAFAPTATGSLGGSLVVTDTALNAAGPSYATQSVPLSGTGTTGPAAQVVVSGIATTIVAGGNPGNYTATIEDANGNVVTSSSASVTATITGPQSYNQVIPGTAASGVATINLSAFYGTAAGNYTIITSSSGLSQSVNNLAVTSGAATHLLVSGLPSTIAAGGNLGTETATLEDVYNNVVTGSSASVTATITGPSYGSNLTISASSGVAILNLTGLPLDASGAYTVVTSSSGATSANNNVTVTSGAAVKVVSNGVSPTLGAGGNLGTITASIEDAHGNVVTASSASITATITGPGNYLHQVTAQAANGTVALDLSSLAITVAGSYTVLTSSSGLTPANNSVTVTAGAATQIVTSGVSSTLNAGGNLATIFAHIEDAYGNVETSSSASVTATVTGPGAYSNAVTSTASAGVASLNLTSPLNTAGAYTVTTSSNGVTSATNNVTVTVGAATQLAVTGVATTIAAGGNLGTITASIEDAHGNVVTTSSASVMATITGPGGFSQGHLVSASNGVASLDMSPIVPTVSGNYTVTTTSTGLTSATNYFAVTPGTLTHLVVTGLPSSIVAGGNVGTETAIVEDSYGNVVFSYSGTMTATIVGPGSYLHQATAPAASGEANVNLGAFALDTAGSYAVATGTSGNGPPAASYNVTVTPATATHLAVSGVPATAMAGGNLGTATVSIEDAYGNVVTSSSAAVTATITGPGGYSHAVIGTASSGVASLNLGSLSLTIPGAYTVTSTSSGLTNAMSPVTVTVGAATQLVTSGLPATITAGGNAGTATVSIEDAYANVVTGSSAAVTVTITGPGGYSHAFTGAAASGVLSANLSSLALTTAGTYTVTSTSSGLPATASTVIVTFGTAAQLAVTGLPAMITAAGNLGTESATIEDAYGNVITSSSAAVSATVTGPGGYSHAVTVAAVNGVATLNLGSLAFTTAGAYTVATTGAGLTTTSTVTITVGVATQLTVNGLSATITAGGNLGTELVTIKDANGNVVNGSTASVTATITGPGNYSRRITSAAFNGVASLNLSSLALTTSGTYTVTTTSVGLISATATVVVSFGPATQLGISGFAPTLAANGNLGTKTVSISDAHYNLVTSSSAAVTVAITGPAGYSPSVTADAVDGIATFNLSSFPFVAAGSYTLAASSGNLTEATVLFTVTPTEASTRLEVSGVTSLIAVGGNEGSILVAVEGSNGSVVTSSTAAVSLAIAGPSGFSKTLSGTAQVGAVTFDLSSLSFTLTGDYTITATSSGLTKATAAFTVAVPAVVPTQLALNTIPATLVQGGDLGTITAVIENSSSGLVSTATAPVLLSITGPSGYSKTIPGTATTGVAIFDLSADTFSALGTYTITATSPGLAEASPKFTVEQGFTLGVSSTSGGGFGGTSTQIVVPGASAIYTLTLAPEGLTFAQSITMTASGLPPGATFTFSPDVLTPGSHPVTTTFTINTLNDLTRLHQDERMGRSFGEMSLALLLLPFAGSRRFRRAARQLPRLGIVLGLVSLAALAGLSGCGTSPSPDTYTVTLTGTSGGIVQTTTVTLIVK